MPVASLHEFIAATGVEVLSVVGSDLHGIARGKQLRVDRLPPEPGAPMRISSLMTVLDAGNLPGAPPAGADPDWPDWRNGFADCVARVDPATARLVPWQPGTGLVLCDFERAADGAPLSWLPRATLRRLLGRVRELGFETRAAHEFELLLFDETARSAREQGWRGLQPLWPAPSAYVLTTLGHHQAVVRGLCDQLDTFGLAVSAWNAEAVAGQLEINLAPADALTAADRGFLLRHAAKELAATLGCQASFMPCYDAHSLGNGSHLHLSLWQDDRNAFHDPAADDGRSALMRHFAAGIAATLPEFTVMYAPTVNAYRRYVPYHLSGMVAAWGGDNRTVAVRTLAGDGAFARIEQRSGGGDANPYLLTAAALAAGLHGIEQGLVLPPCDGDAYADPNLPRVPADLATAIALFERSAVARHYLGDAFVQHYAHSRRLELEAFNAAHGDAGTTTGVTDWELQRYF